MNIIRTISMLFFAASLLLASSCQKEASSGMEYLEVSAHNISGQWELVEWNGSALLDGTYMYIDIVRDERTYTIYQNIDSFNDVPHIITGAYYIESDTEYGAVIRGSYDHDLGYWAHRYIVRDLTHSDMTWIAKDDESFVQKFRRVEDIPVAPSED